MNSALLVIDMQRGLFGEKPEPFETAEVVARINELASRARDAGAPVVFIQHERPGTSVEHGSEGWRLLEGIVVLPGDLLVAKTTPDSFLRTNLEEILAVRSVERVVVCGYATEFCVDTTVRRAAALGHPVVLVSDAHTTQDKAHASAEQIRAHHNATLLEIASFGVRIEATPASAVVFDEQV